MLVYLDAGMSLILPDFGNLVECYFEADKYRFLSPLSRWARLANNRETQIAIFSGN